MNEIKKALSNLEPNEKAKERVWEGLERDSKHKRKRVFLIAAVVVIFICAAAIGINAVSGGRFFNAILGGSDSTSARESAILSEGDEIYAPEIIFLNKTTLVIESKNAVFVYDRNKKKVTRTIDLQSIGGYYIDHGDDFGKPPVLKTHTLVEDGKIIVFNTRRDFLGGTVPDGDAYVFSMTKNEKYKRITDDSPKNKYYEKWLKNEKNYVDCFDTFYYYLENNNLNGDDGTYSYRAYVSTQNGKKLYSFIITDSENSLCLCTSTDKKSIKKEYFKLLSDKKYWNYHKKNKLPEFKYSGSDKVMKAVIEYEQARNDELLYSDNVWIPFFTELCRKDDGDELKVFVEIWQFEYQRQGDVLEGTNGGDGMAKYTLKKEKGGYKVIEVEYASDGALLEESIKKMSEGDASVYMKISGRTQPNYEFLDMYIRDNNLNVKYRRVNGEIA